MPSTKWNDEEESALQSLPLLAQVLYLRCFRRFMDYDSGIVGIARKVGYQMMAETCETLRDKGSTQSDYKPTRYELRAAVRQLVRRGLLSLVSKPLEQPVYHLPLATTNNHAFSSENFAKSKEVGGFSFQEEQQRNDKGTPMDEQPAKTVITPLYMVDSQGMNNKGTAKEQPGMNSIHQGSVLPNLTIPVQISLNEEETKNVLTTPSAWSQFFMQHVRFGFHEVKTVSAMTMFRLWCEAKLSLPEAVIAIEAAEVKLNQRPDNPLYYKNFVTQVIRDRNSKLKPQGISHAKTNKRPSAKEIAIEILGGGRLYEHENRD